MILIRLMVVFLCLRIAPAYAQARKDTIRNFSLQYSSIGKQGSYTLKIDDKGKILAKVTTGSGDVMGEKKISMDKNTFRQFKNKIITEAGFYSMKDRKIVNCNDCSDERLEITTDKGTKVIEGHLLHLGSANAKSLFDALENMVGFIGRTDDH
jgi:hypothetical protein